MWMDSHDSKILSFKDLEAWKQSRLLAILVIEATRPVKGAPFDRGLYDQMRRAALSIPSNLAEGDERGTNKDALRFLYMSRGSLAELRTQADIANATGYLSTQCFEEIEFACVKVGKLLSGLIRSRRNRERPPPRSP